MDRTYKNLGYFFLLLIPLIFAGFYKSYFQPFPNFEADINTSIHLHALIASVWILMLIVQPFLIFNKKQSIHRIIGKLSYIIFPLLILSFVPQIIKFFHSAHIENLFFPLGDGLLLILFYCLAIYHRKNSSKHMRYMIATSLFFLGPTVGRIGPILLSWTELMTQNVQYAIIYSILIALILYDRKNNRKYQPYLVAIAAFIIHQIIFHVVFL